VEYIQGLTVQTRMFAYFFALGFLLGLLYDVLRIIRVIVFLPRKNVFVLDALFGSIAAFVTFVCLLVLNHGQVQVFILAAQGLGALVYIFSLGGAMTRFRGGLIWTKRKTIETAIRPAKFLFRKSKSLFGRISNKIHKFLIKTRENVKNRLQSEHRLRYNNTEDSWIADLLEEEESQASGGKVKGIAYRAKNKKARKAKQNQKAAQPVADNRGNFVREPVHLSDDIPDKRSRRSKKADSRKAKRGSRNPLRKRKVRRRTEANQRR